MILPDQLTEEAGFYPGVVVEIVWDHSGPDKIELAYWEAAKEWSTECMVSVHPLTGPMSIWNHAPEWAKSCYVFDDGINWKTSNSKYRIEEWPELDGMMSDRPWWAK